MPQTQVVQLPQRQGLDYGKLGGLVGQAINPQAQLQQKLLPLLLQEQFKSQLQRQRQNELISGLVQGGNGPGGDFDISVGPSGITYKQKSPKQKLEDIQAREDLGFYGQQGQPQQQQQIQPQQIPPQIQGAMVAPTAPSVGVPTAPPGLPPSITRQLQIDIAKKQAGAKATAKGTEFKEKLKRQRQFRETTAAFRGIVGQYKGMVAEREDMETGLIPGAIGALKAKTFQKGVPRTAAFEGQRTETTFRLNSILTGQNRVIRGVVGMIQATLPTRFDPADMAAQKVAQSVTNAYKLTRAFKEGGFTTDVLNKMSQEELDALPVENLVANYALTPAENLELEAILQDVLATPAEKERGFPEFTMPKQVKRATTDIRTEYNKLRSSGLSATEARRKLRL